MPALRLGLLDFGTRDAGEGARARIEESLETARRAERLGFSRYWIPEHHSDPVGSHASPEIMVAWAAAETRSIRVGSAGVLLRFYNAFKVAEVFRLLEARFPGRIDLGIAAGYSEPAVERALLDGRAAPTRGQYEARVEDLAHAVRGDAPDGHPYHGLRVVPAEGRPEVWVLGSGAGGAGLAATVRANFSFGLFLGRGEAPSGVEALRSFRAETDGLPGLARPLATNVAVGVVCADTEAEARRIADGQTNPFKRKNVVGSPEQCAQALQALAASHGVGEVVVAPLASRPEERAAMSELLARSVRLQAIPG